MRNKIKAGDQFKICDNKSYHDFILGSLVEVVKVLPCTNKFRLDKRPRYECKLIEGSFRFFTEYDKDRDNEESFSQVWESDFVSKGSYKVK